MNPSRTYLFEMLQNQNTSPFLKKKTTKPIDELDAKPFLFNEIKYKPFLGLRSNLLQIGILIFLLFGILILKNKVQQTGFRQLGYKGVRLHQRRAGFAELVHVTGIRLGGMVGIHERAQGLVHWSTTGCRWGGGCRYAAVVVAHFLQEGGVWQKSARVWAQEGKRVRLLYI